MQEERQAAVEKVKVVEPIKEPTFESASVVMWVGQPNKDGMESWTLVAVIGGCSGHNPCHGHDNSGRHYDQYVAA